MCFKLGENFPIKINPSVNRSLYLPLLPKRVSSVENEHPLHVNTVSGSNDLGVNNTKVYHAVAL